MDAYIELLWSETEPEPESPDFIRQQTGPQIHEENQEELRRQHTSFEDLNLPQAVREVFPSEEENSQRSE